MLLQWGRWSQSSPSRIPFYLTQWCWTFPRRTTRFAPHVDAELLKEEWNDFKLLDEGAVSIVDAKGKQQTLDKVWSEIST